MLQTKFRMDKLFRVPAGAFTPPPKVESAVVRLVPRSARGFEEVDEKVFRAMVAAAFSARRKTLRNALAKWFDEAALRALGFDPKLRPENLSPDDYLRLAQHARSRVRDDFLSDRPLNETKPARDPFAALDARKPARRK